MTPQYWLTMIVLSLTLGLSYASGTAVSGDAARGQDIYERHCVACHGP